MQQKKKYNIKETIKILGLTWKTEINSDIAREGQCYGSTHHTSQKFFFDPDQTDEHMEQTLLHEILHAIWWQTGLNQTFKDQKTVEEQVISSITPLLHQVLKENKLYANRR